MKSSSLPARCSTTSNSMKRRPLKPRNSPKITSQRPDKRAGVRLVAARSRYNHADRVCAGTGIEVFLTHATATDTDCACSRSQDWNAFVTTVDRDCDGD